MLKIIWKGVERYFWQKLSSFWSSLSHYCALSHPLDSLRYLEIFVTVTEYCPAVLLVKSSLFACRFDHPHLWQEQTECCLLAGGPWCQYSVDFLSFPHVMIKLWFWEFWHPPAHFWQGQACSWVPPASTNAWFIQILTPFDGCVHPFLLKAYGFISGQKEVEIQTPSLGAFCWVLPW